MSTLKHLNSLQAVEAAVRLGSQKAAGEELGITAAAVGQRIRALEDYLGCELLERGRGGVRPTPALESALDSLAKGFDALGHAADLLRYSSHNTVRLAVDPDWAALWLQPRLPAFMAAHPNTEILLDTSARPVDRYDLRVSLDADPEAGTLLYRDYLLPLCSPENLARIIDLRDGEKLEGFPLLHLEGPAALSLDWPGWVQRHGQRRGGADRGVRYGRMVPAVRAVKSSVGMLICGISLVRDELDSGELRMPFGTAPGESQRRAYMLAAHPPALKRPAVRQFRDWLADQAEDTHNWLDRVVPASGA